MNIGFLQSSLLTLCTIAVAIGLSACDRDPLATGAPEESGCSDCHGSAQNAAPPAAAAGDTDPSFVGVGAHQPHVMGNLVFPAVACEECHVMPTTVEEEGHVDDLPAEVVFGTLASSGGATPSWDRESETCSDVYCHGATLSGAMVTSPKWTQVDGTQSVCGACHGYPPPAPHSQSASCEDCHVAMADGQHVNGVVDFGGDPCSVCHGGPDNAAPPVDVDGNSDTTLVTVGAHQAHLASSDWRAPIACEECHVVPTSTGDPGHNDGGDAQVIWGATASADGATPSFDRTTTTCTGVYCHGATLMTGGSLTDPSWTVVDGTQAACGTCHGMPPGGTHFPVATCEDCHSTVWDGSGFVDPALHVNGIVDDDF